MSWRVGGLLKSRGFLQGAEAAAVTSLRGERKRVEWHAHLHEPRPYVETRNGVKLEHHTYCASHSYQNRNVGMFFISLYIYMLLRRALQLP